MGPGFQEDGGLGGTAAELFSAQGAVCKKRQSLSPLSMAVAKSLLTKAVRSTLVDSVAAGAAIAFPAAFRGTAAPAAGCLLSTVDCASAAAVFFVGAALAFEATATSSLEYSYSYSYSDSAAAAVEGFDLAAVCFFPAGFTGAAGCALVDPLVDLAAVLLPVVLFVSFAVFLWLGSGLLSYSYDSSRSVRFDAEACSRVFSRDLCLDSLDLSQRERSGRRATSLGALSRADRRSGVRGRTTALWSPDLCGFLERERVGVLRLRSRLRPWRSAGFSLREPLALSRLASRE